MQGMPLAEHTSLRGGVRVYLPPVLGNVNAAAEPHPIVAAHMVEEFYQASGACWTADQAVVQANGHEPGVLRALFVEQVKGIPHILEEVVCLGKTMTLITAIVVGLVGVGNDQMGLSSHLDPVG